MRISALETCLVAWTEGQEDLLRLSQMGHVVSCAPESRGLFEGVKMQEHQNAFQNAGQNGYSYYVSMGNQSSPFPVLLLSFVLLIALLRSEGRYRKLLAKANENPVNPH